MTGSRACSLMSRQGLVHPSGPAQVLNRCVWILKYEHHGSINYLSFVIEGREEDMVIGYGTKGTIFKECGLRE